ncbi:MAG: hypothetical protein C0625_02785 [Arcobacter sp.]|nr:MAG: hypothetical protein C0625_02785 [Arcobacter sp.]
MEPTGILFTGKKIIAIISTIFIFGLMLFTFYNGTAFQGGEAGNIIENIKVSSDQIKVKNQVPTNDNIEEDKIKALREKAGNTSSFEVSNAYRRKCASCHGVDGSGMQNGKKLMGPRLMGQEKEKLYKDLADFKAGRKENLIMKGLLINLSDEELKNFANEIAQFKAKKEALTK